MHEPLVLCPLKCEARVLARALRGKARIEVIGPGPEAAKSAIEKLSKNSPPIVILCGLGGGLAPTGPVPWVARVADHDGRVWDCPVEPVPDAETVTLLGIDRPVVHPEKKRILAESFGASLVDCESHAFAQAAESSDLRWAVVRGVSDGPKHRLPDDIDQWVDSRGRMRIGFAMLRILLEIGLIVVVIPLAWRSHWAMRRVRKSVLELLAREAGQASQ